MAPSEIEILENYLLQPAHLTSITTLDQFKLLFPARYHDSLQLRSLFRDLQAIRGGVIEEVEAAIAIESKEGKIMRREMVRERRAAEMEEADGEIEMERALFGSQSGIKAAKHNISSIVPELNGAVAVLESENVQLLKEEEELTLAVNGIIGNLSDLRYGKLANQGLKDEILDSLASLQTTCESKT